MKWRWRYVSWRAALLAAAAVSLTPLAAQYLISVQEEIELGRRTQREVKSKTPEVKDQQVLDYVRGIGRTLAARAGGPKYPYSFSVANHREINAFALPGGPVWIHRATISAAKNEAQIASVLAHEIAHVAQRHAADQLTKNLIANGLLGLLGAVLGNDGGARTAQVAAQVMANGYMLKFSRDDEREADRVGARIMRQAGWDPREMIAFMELLRRQQGRDPGSVEVFLSSHPGPAERARLLRDDLRSVSGGRKDSQHFQEIRSRVQRMPAAPAPRPR